VSFFSEITEPGTASVVGAAITAIVSIQTLFLKWLVDRFDKLSSALKDQAASTHDWLTDHEEKDQRRHEENLYRFEKIAVALARLGSTHNTHRDP
jgi:hypothetical protein